MPSAAAPHPSKYATGTLLADQLFSPPITGTWGLGLCDAFDVPLYDVAVYVVIIYDVAVYGNICWERIFSSSFFHWQGVTFLALSVIMKIIMLPLLPFLPGHVDAD